MILVATPEQPEPLGALGLTLEDLHRALRAGDRERRTCTKLDARSAPSFLMWTRTIRILRETLIPRRWKAVDLNQLPLIVNHDRTIGIAVSSGDSVTGLVIPGVQPKTRNPKGAVTVAVVKRNEDLALFPLSDIVKEPEPDDYSRLRTYYLLWYFDRKKSELRAELSQPEAVGSDGRIDSWISPRIIIPSIQMTRDVELRADDDAVDVDVF